MHKVLCVEDAPDIHAILESILAGHHLTFATTVKQAVDALNHDQFSLVLLDIELPDGSGMEVMAALSGRLKSTQVIFLTGKQDFASKVSAFSLGADDFIVKPFDPKELRLRIDAKLRKLDDAKASDHILKIGTLVCNLQEQRLYKKSGSEPVDLTSLEFRIFHMLAKTPNRIFSREEIIDRIWGTAAAVTDRVVDVHISNVRKKIAGTNVTIDAAVGAGYRILVK